MEEILETALKHAGDAEVFYEEDESREISFENNKLKYVNTKALRGVGLRIIKDGRIGFSSTTDLSRTDKLVEQAVASAMFGQEAKFEFPSTKELPDVKVNDKRVVDYSMENGVAVGTAGIERVLSANPNVKCSVDIGKGYGTTRLLNSRGLDVQYDSTSYGFSIQALWARDEGLVWVTESHASRALNGDLLRLADRVIQKLMWCEKELSIGIKTMPVIFVPKCAGELLHGFLMGANGKLVQKGTSPFAGRIGERLLDERISIHDDSTIDYAVGTEPIDGEGLPAGTTAIYDDGILKSYIFDLQTAGMMNAKPTGNGIRGFNSQPVPGYSNIIVSAGGMSLDEMTASMKRGLLVDQVLGAGQSNVLAGEFSVNVDLGFLVEKGEVVGRVKNCMAAGNAFELMKKVVDVSADAEWHGSMRLPAIYLDSVSVAGGTEE